MSSKRKSSLAPQRPKAVPRSPVLIAVLFMIWFAFWGGCQATHPPISPLKELGFERIINRDTVWKQSNSPYHIYQNSLILPEATLTIEPGVEVLIGPGVNIYCQGRIVAKGEPEQPIRFRGLEGAPWGKIDCFGGRHGKTGQVPINIFQYCIVEGGHGIVARASAIHAESSTFRDNVSTPLRLEYSFGKIIKNKIYRNSTELEAASGNGGGIMVYTDKEVFIEQNHVHDNISKGGRDGGGGIYAYAYDQGKVSVLRNRIYRNQSDRFGGGLVAYACQVQENEIIENTAEDSGGGIYAIRATIRDNRVEGNRAQRGGGIYAENTQLQLNTISDNRAPSFMGGGLFYYGEGRVEKNTFFRNGSPGEQPGEAIVVSGSPVLRKNNIVSSLGYALRVQTHSLAPDLDATKNFWGTKDLEAVCACIYDWLDDSEVGLVDWKGFHASWISQAPPAPAAFQGVKGDLTDRSSPAGPSKPPRPSDLLKGPILEDLTLGRPDGTTYRVTGNLIIPEGISVNILPGTVFEISPGITLRVRGTLVAEGKTDRPIRFTGDPNRPWGQLLFEAKAANEASSAGQEGAEKGLLRHCIVEHGRGIMMEETAPLVAECIIRRNHGSGIRVREASARILNNRIVENQSPSNGGGIYAYGSKFVYISKNKILNNRAKEDGGGVFAYGYRSTTAVNLSGNLIQDNRCAGDGAGIWASRSSVVDNRILSNQAEGKGGGVFATFALVQDNEISKNSALQGGGVYAETNSSLERNRIVENRGLDAVGGAVYLNFWGMSIKNEVFRKNLVTGNSAATADGNGGIYLNGSMIFEYNLIYGNNGFELYNANPADRPPLSAPHCYWGTDQETEIEAAVHDGLDDPGLARVLFTPFASSAKEIAVP